MKSEFFIEDYATNKNNDYLESDCIVVENNLYRLEYHPNDDDVGQSTHTSIYLQNNHLKSL